MSSSTRPPVLVLGDICLDVVGLPTSRPPTSDAPRENWRQTGELRTHFLPGGAMLLAGFIRAARRAGGCDGQDLMKNQDPEAVIAGPRPAAPPGVPSAEKPLGEADFLELAPRLRREEVLHSVLGAAQFPATSEANEKKTRPRVRHEYGYSGPQSGVPSLAVTYGPNAKGRIAVISDIGNQFRFEANQWPTRMLDGATQIVYKLHRPLPDDQHPNNLWKLAKRTAECTVILDIDDLRADEIPIGQGLSWERTATELVWHLLNVERLRELRECGTLVVRLGLDGALVWGRRGTAKAPTFEASLVYDPDGIEGAFAATVPGKMVGYGSAFTAAIVEALAEQSVRARRTPEQERGREDPLIGGIKAGLLAARRLLRAGFDDAAGSALRYPESIFCPQENEKETRFAHQRMPIIPSALEADRGYWRLLDTIFTGSNRLQEAVELVATNRRGTGSFALAQELLDAVPRATFGALKTYDRREIEHYRALYSLLRDYLRTANPSKPLSVAVFGAPGAGKSFGVKEVAKSLKGQPGCKEIDALTFNLSLFRTPDDLAGAFHLVRDVVLRGKIPLVFFDEFDTTLSGVRLGWLRHFLAPMQDGEFLDREAPHPIGPAIFIFAGGTSSTFATFEAHAGMDTVNFAAAKGPDFISRLRATLDIPSLNLGVAFHRNAAASETSLNAKVARLLDTQGLESFDPYGPVEAIPSLAAVLLRRAGILAFNLAKKAPNVVRADKSLAISKPVLRALMHLPQFRHGNRSFEALLDMSHLDDATALTPARLPPPFQISLHADAVQIGQFIGTDYPFPDADRLSIAQAIHAHYLSRGSKTKANKPWDRLDADDKESNFEQADDIAAKLRTVGLWFRKISTSSSAASRPRIGPMKDYVEMLAVLEHDRWAAQRRRAGWAAAKNIAATSRQDRLLLHNCLFPWEELSEKWWRLDRETVRKIPGYLAKAGYEIIKP